MSGRSAFGFGILVGLITTCSVAGAFLALSPVEVVEAAAKAPEAAKPVPESFSKPQVAEKPAVAPKPVVKEPEVKAEAAPEPEVKGEVAPKPEVKVAEPKPEKSEPVTAAKPQPATETKPEPVKTAALTEPKIEPSPEAPKAPVAVSGEEKDSEAPARPSPDKTVTAAIVKAPEATPQHGTNAPEIVEEAPVPEVETLTRPQFIAWSVPFEGDLTQPVLAIVLTDADAKTASGLQSLDPRIAIALAPGNRNAGELADEIHKAGYEVLAASGGKIENAGPVIGVVQEKFRTNNQVEAEIAALKPRGAALLDITAPGGGIPLRLARAGELPAAAAAARIDEYDSSEMVYQSLEQAAADAREAGPRLPLANSPPQPSPVFAAGWG